jgi:hypothetical protein
VAFRFRLAKVLEWYDRLYQIEAERLRQSAARAQQAHQNLIRHRELRLESEQEMLQMDSLQGEDMAARERYRRRSLLQEAHLGQLGQDADKEVEAQRTVALAARRKVLLVEKLRDRKREEFNYLAARELEEIAADSWLAGYARSLVENESIQDG